MKKSMMVGRILRLFAAGTALICMICLLSPSVFASNGEITLTVKQVCAGADFRYHLRPEQADNPMPSGSGTDGYAFSVTGTNDIAIGPISFAQAGIYTYQLSPIKSCACALAPYTLYIFVERDLKISVVARKPDGTKAMDIRFEHACDEAASTPESTTAPNSTTSAVTRPSGGGSVITRPAAGDGPKTGDESQTTLYIALFCAASVAFLGSIIYLLTGKRPVRRKKL